MQSMYDLNLKARSKAAPSSTCRQDVSIDLGDPLCVVCSVFNIIFFFLLFCWWFSVYCVSVPSPASSASNSGCSYSTSHCSFCEIQSWVCGACAGRRTKIACTCV